MNKLTFAGLCVAALATSCSNDFSTDGRHTVQLEASVSAEQTRAAFLSTGAFYWQEGDQIGVTTTGNEKSVSESFTAFTLKSGAKTGSATFEGTITGDISGYAIYPYDAAQKVSNNTLTYTFPKEYTYTKVDQTFFPENQDGNSFRPAMLASVADNGVAFKHLGGVFCIDVESMPCAAGTITLTTNQKLCGEFTATVTDATPELKTADATVTTDNAVTITFSGAEEGKEGVFYIPAATGVYTDAKVTITPTNGTAKEVYAGKYTMERANLYRLALKQVTIDATTETTTTDASGVESALGSSDNVAVTGEVTDNATISIPETTSSSSTAAKTVTLQKVANDATITIADKNTSTTEADASKSVQNLTVSVPNNATNAPSMTITMPNTTVTLAGNAGTATFKKVTASTAENTLVVSNGVTIKELEIAKGNVRINSGASVESITLASGNTSAVIYYEDGATLPSTLPSGCVKKGIIETQAQFAAAMSKGGDYALLKDLTLTQSTVVTTKTIGIDLNNKTLSANSEIYTKGGGNLTFTNGSIAQKGQALNVGSSGKLTLDNVKYTGSGWSCVFVEKNTENTSVTIKNSTLVVKDGYYTVTTNASTNPVASNCTINLENSTFESGHNTYGGTALLINIPATVTMKDCSFTGYCQAALLRGGTYEIDNCSFTLDAKFDSSDTGNKWLTTWGTGNECAYAALTIGNYLNTSYQYPTKVTFKASDSSKKSKATVSGTNASIYPAIHVCANAGTDLGVTVTGLSNITTEGGKNPAIEYGTTNITVDNTTPSVNCTASN